MDEFDDEDFLNVKLNPPPNFGLSLFRSLGLSLLIGLEEAFFLCFFPSANQSSCTFKRFSPSSELFSEFVLEDFPSFPSNSSPLNTLLQLGVAV